MRWTIEAAEDEAGRWAVASPWWRLPMVDERTARRVAEIMTALRESGRREMAAELRALLDEGAP
jgi:hypothetical protein